MKNEEACNIIFLVLIAGRKQKGAILSALIDAKVHVINTIYGRGAIKAGYLESIFGFAPEEQKVVMTCVLTLEKTNIVLNLLTEKFNFNKPNTGVAFTVPIDRLVF